MSQQNIQKISLEILNTSILMFQSLKHCLIAGHVFTLVSDMTI